MAGVAIKLERA